MSTQNSQHQSSVQHRLLLNSGLTVRYVRTTGSTDLDWDVVHYSDGSFWLYDNGSASPATFLGTVRDGLNRAEILQLSNGAILAIYEDGPQAFADSEAWISSIPDTDIPEAQALFS